MYPRFYSELNLDAGGILFDQKKNSLSQDDGNPSLSSKEKLVIDVTDSGDKKPTFHFNLSDREVNENTRIGTEIAHVQARDGDRAINNKIGYVILSGMVFIQSGRLILDIFYSNYKTFQNDELFPEKLCSIF